MTDLVDDIEAMEGKRVGITYTRPGGETWVEGLVLGRDETYQPAHEFDTDGPRYEVVDVNRGDRDFALYPNGLGELGAIYGVYDGERSPDEQSLGEVRRIEVLDDE